MKAQICIPEIYSGLYSEFVWFCPDIHLDLISNFMVLLPLCLMFLTFFFSGNTVNMILLRLSPFFVNVWYLAFFED